MDTDFDGLTVILEKELVDIASTAYTTGTITGDSTIPSFTVILNKIKEESKNFNIVENCISLKYRQDFSKELSIIKQLNNIN